MFHWWLFVTMLRFKAWRREAAERFRIHLDDFTKSMRLAFDSNYKEHDADRELRQWERMWSAPEREDLTDPDLPKVRARRRRGAR